MQMAPGISGRETFARIRERHPRQKALIASGFSTGSDVELTLQHGAGAFIKKPYSMVELGRAVHDVLQAE
jgi:DNA-binding NarL/FixJ family response regulator